MEKFSSFFRTIFIGSILFFSFSCAPVSYQHIYRNSKGLDFSSGNWLISYPEGNFSNQFSSRLHTLLVEKFADMASDTVVSISAQSFDYILPDALGYEITKETLSLLGKTSNFKYFVAVKALNKRENLDLILSEPPLEYGKNESELFLEVYDVPSGEKIYSQQIIASVNVEEGDEDIKFANSSGTLIFKALNKGLKKTRKYSTFK